MTVGLEICSCENVSNSDLGSVDNRETLARVIISPRHFRKNGGLKPGAFPVSHIAETGLSLMRLDYLTRQEITDHAIAIGGKEVPAGYLATSATNIRSILDAALSVQSLCLIDDPVKDDKILPDNPAHAIAIRSMTQDEPEIMRIQSVLVDIFGKLLPFDNLATE